MMISNLNLAKLPECVCEMRYIDSALLTPCAEYQRVLRTRKVEEISASFSEYVANEPRVSYRDGRYHVLMVRTPSKRGSPATEVMTSRFSAKSFTAFPKRMKPFCLLFRRAFPPI